MADQGETTLPTKQEIAELPRWAVVAFAARCARRVQTLFQVGWPDAPDEYGAALEWAIALSELAAAHTVVADTAGYLDASGRMVGDVAAKAAHLNAYAAAAAAADAADAAADAYAAAASAASAAFAAADAYAYADTYAAAAKRSIEEAIWVDFEHLQSAAEQQKWNNQTPVPPEFFGPLWPEGEPEGWPYEYSVNVDTKIDVWGLGISLHPDADHVRSSTPEIEIYLDPGEASKDEIQAVLDALSDLHFAAGGLGLEFRTDGHRVYAIAGVAP